MNDSIKKLNLCRCYCISDEAFKDIGNGEKLMLKIINLSFCSELTSIALIELASSCPSLGIIFIKGAPKICDTGLASLASNCPLQVIDLSMGSNMTGRASASPRLGPSGIKALGLGCSNLRILKCNFCTRIDDRSLKVVLNRNHQLEEICLQGCYKISNTTLIEIGNNCEKLKVINISSCKKISDDGVVSLVKRCNLLVDIDLSNTSVTDTAIVKMSEHCKVLTSINLRNCSFISDDSISVLLLKCPLLEKIDLRGVYLVTDNALKHFDSSHFRTSYLKGTSISLKSLASFLGKALFSVADKDCISLVPRYVTPKEATQHYTVSYLLTDVY
jgi:hypothetical protein